MIPLNSKEILFYIVFSLTTFLITTGYLVFRYVNHIVIGPILFIVYLFPALFSIFLFWHASRKSPQSRNVFFGFFTVGSVVLLLFLSLEIFFRIINFPPVVTKYDQAHTQSTFNRFKTLMDLREKRLDALLFMSLSYLKKFSVVYNTDLFLSNVGNAYIVEYEEDDGVIVFQSDSNGLRNPAGLYENFGNFDVFLLGDSFTQGSSVPDGFTIADKIREKTRLSVYNAGLGGSGLITQLSLFIEYGLRKKPKNVVLIFIEGVSLSRAFSELNDARLNKYWENFESRDIYMKNSIRDKQLREILEIELLKKFLEYTETDLVKGRSHFSIKDFWGNSKVRLFLVRNFIEKVYEKNEGYPDCQKMGSGRELLERLFRYYQTATAKYGGNFSVVYLPDSRYYSISEWKNCEYDLMVSICKQLNIPMIDMVKVFARFDDPRVFFAKNYFEPRIGGHCNQKGYALIAEEIVTRTLLNRNESNLINQSAHAHKE